jgi:hypothetical protein
MFMAKKNAGDREHFGGVAVSKTIGARNLGVFSLVSYPAHSGAVLEFPVAGVWPPG